MIVTWQRFVRFLCYVAHLQIGFCSGDFAFWPLHSSHQWDHAWALSWIASLYQYCLLFVLHRLAARAWSTWVTTCESRVIWVIWALKRRGRGAEKPPPPPTKATTTTAAAAAAATTTTAAAAGTGRGKGRVRGIAIIAIARAIGMGIGTITVTVMVEGSLNRNFRQYGELKSRWKAQQ